MADQILCRNSALVVLSILFLSRCTPVSSVDPEKRAWTRVEAGLGTFSFGSQGESLTINGIPAIDYVISQGNDDYPCMTLTNEPYLKQNVHADLALEQSKFYDKLSNCKPYYSSIISTTLNRLGAVGAAAERWFSTMEKFLLERGSAGYEELLAASQGSLRDNEVSLRLKKDALLEKDVNNFGSMTPTIYNQADLDDLAKFYSRRAYHAGDGFCTHLTSAPFNHLGKLIELILAREAELKNGQDNSRNGHQLFDILFGPDKVESILSLSAIQVLCKNFASNPSDELIQKMRYIDTYFGLIGLNLHETNRYIERFMAEIRRDNTRSGRTCSWFSLFKIKQIFKAIGEFSVASHVIDTLNGRMNLAANKFLENCTRILIKSTHFNERRPFSPSWPNNMIVGNLLARFETQLMKSGKTGEENSALLHKLDTRNWSGPNRQIDRVWLTYPGEFFEEFHDANERLVLSYASGRKFCNFYLLDKAPHVKFPHQGRFLIVELMLSLLSEPNFELNLKNRATDYFQMWRLCWLNSLFPIVIDKDKFEARVTNQDPTSSGPAQVGNLQIRDRSFSPSPSPSSSDQSED